MKTINELIKDIIPELQGTDDTISFSINKPRLIEIIDAVRTETINEFAQRNYTETDLEPNQMFNR